MLVRELMTRIVESTTPTTTLTEAARTMRDRNIGCLPVNDSDGFIGMLTEKDLTTRATAEGLNPTTTTVRQIMTSGITYCHEDDTLEHALRTMEDKHMHHLLVRLGGSNKVVGIVSLSDLALKGPQELYSNASRLAFQSASLNHASTTRPLN
jgi:CBS domain-containing protein